MARFQTGNKGGPGRPKGSKNKLQEAFWRDFSEAWEANGKAALEHVAQEDQATFVRVAASIMPKEAEVTMRQVSAKELSDDELAGIIANRRSNGIADTPVDPSQLN